MSEDNINQLLSRLVLSFLTKNWAGRTHVGLLNRLDVMDRDEIKEEIERFIVAINDSGRQGSSR